MKARLRLPQSCAALFFIGSEKAALIESVLGSVNMSVIIPPHDSYGGKIGSLLKLSGYSDENVPPPEDMISEELIIFSGVDRKALDAALDALRNNGISIPFKAVITPHNKDFTLPELMAHMEDERREIENRG